MFRRSLGWEGDKLPADRQQAIFWQMIVAGCVHAPAKLGAEIARFLYDCKRASDAR